MDNIRQWEIMEDTIIGTYNLGRLDGPLLMVILEPYRGYRIELGNYPGIESNDGLTVDDVILRVAGVPLFTKPVIDANGAWWISLSEAFEQATKHLGW